MYNNSALKWNNSDNLLEPFSLELGFEVTTKVSCTYAVFIWEWRQPPQVTAYLQDSCWQRVQNHEDISYGRTK